MKTSRPSRLPADSRAGSEPAKPCPKKTPGVFPADDANERGSDQVFIREDPRDPRRIRVFDLAFHIQASSPKPAIQSPQPTPLILPDSLMMSPLNMAPQFEERRLPRSPGVG